MIRLAEAPTPRRARLRRTCSGLSRASEVRRGTSLRALAQALAAQLHDAGIEQPQVEAEWLLAGSLGLRRTELYLREDLASPQFLEQVERMLARRLRGEPLQYVLGSTEFCGHRILVNPSVLIPRPETEVLTECACRAMQRLMEGGRRTLTALDVGTGSANIAISLAHALRTCLVVAIELSWEALRTASANVAAHGLGERIHLLQADWTSGVGGRFDVIISNPPYVATGEVERLPASVRREPRESLDGGADGMRFHRRLCDEAPRLLAPGGVMCVESAEAQAQPLRQLVRAQPWVKQVSVVEDLAGRPRGLVIERR